MLPSLMFGQTWKFTERRDGRNAPLSIIESYDHGLIFPVSDIDIHKDIFLYKLNVNGDLLWKKNFQYKNRFFETTDIIELKDGGYILCGSTQAIDTSIDGGDPFLLKLNSCFEPIWFNVYNEPSSYNRIDHVLEYNGKLLVSFAYLNSNYITMAILDNDGNMVRNRTLTEIFTNKIYIKKDKTIQIIAFTGVFGLFKDPYKGIDKGILLELDSNLNVFNKQYYYLSDTTFESQSFDFCYIDSNEYNFLTLSANLHPNPNKNIYGSVMITKNYDNSGWHKIINDTSRFAAGNKMIRLNSNRFAIISNYGPDLNQPFLVHGLNFIIDSNANVICSQFENPGNKVSYTLSIIKTHDDKIITIGGMNRIDDNYDLFCYKYNYDLTPFTKTNIVKNYDTLCSKALSSSTIQLPNPTIINLNKDSFVTLRKPVFSEVINIFPNPSYGNVNIQTNKNYILDIYDIQGKFIANFENEQLIEITEGIYIFRFLIEGNIVYRKVLILH